MKSIWDNGELVLGYGEFMENNKNLVPAGYTMDCGQDLLEFISNQDEADELAVLLGVNSNDLPSGLPASATSEDVKFHTRRKWHSICQILS